ncbi:MAG: rbfA [Rickettsiaceae bacterium]|jgi:ribosome-binding factor A|nr:rbfA [Rickettsiaceae bacterium]
MIKRSAKAPSQRQLRAASLIREALIEVLRNGKALDSRLLSTSVTVSDVKLSPDLKAATCFVLPFGFTKITEEDLMEALEASKYSIRSQVTKKINLRYSPDLKFVYDESFEKAFTIDKLLKQNINTNLDSDEE